MLWRVMIVLLAIAVPAGAQQATPHAKAVEEGASGRRAVPWLVTVVHTLSVKDVIDQLRAKGFLVSPLNKATSRSQAITNVTSGLVIGPSGRILVRLANFKDKLGVPIRPKPEAITVITGDGRRLKPSVVAYDPTTGYSVLEVPDLAVKPPAFASTFTPSQQGEQVRLLFQVPDHIAARAESDSRASRAPAAKKLVGPIPIQRANEPLGLRIVEDSVRITPRGGTGRARSGDVNVVELKLDRSTVFGESVVLNKRGQVVGLMEFLGPAMGVVKSIDQLRAMAERLLLQNERRRGWLGIRVEQLSNAAVKQQFSPHAAGKARLRVKDVFPNSPAERAGVRPGDFIRRVNGQLVKTLGQLAALTSPLPVGSEVRLEILRDEAVHQLTLRIAPRPSGFARALTRANRFGRTPALERAAGDERARVQRTTVGTPAGRLLRWGLKVESLTDQLRTFFGVPGTGGVLVTEVTMTRPAGQVGLRAGDVIVAVNGEPVANERDLVERLHQFSRSSGKIALSIYRHRRPLVISVEPSRLF